MRHSGLYVLAAIVLAIGMTAPAAGAAAVQHPYQSLLGAADSAPVAQQSGASSSSIITTSASDISVRPGQQVSITYEVTNPSNTTTSSLVEFTKLPTNGTLVSVSGDVSQDVTGSSPPGLITAAIEPGETATVTATYQLNQSVMNSTAVTAEALFIDETGEVLVSGSTSVPITIEQRDVIAAPNGGASIVPSGTERVTIQVNNTIDADSSVLVEFIELPENVTVVGASGAVGEKLLNSTPPAVVTTSVGSGESTTVQIVFRVAEDTTAGGTVSIRGTVQSGASNASSTTRVNITAATSLETRFGGSDREVGNFDVLRAVNAANSGGTVGGKPVSNFDILQLVNQATN